MNNKKETSLNNIVCKAESAEHGAEIIKAFKALGVDVKKYEGDSICYYGLINGNFNTYEKHGEAKIVTLQELQAMAKPELTFPIEMYVWENDYNKGIKAMVIAHIRGLYHSVSSDTLFEYNNNESYCVDTWNHAEEIQETVKMTLEQIEEELGHKIEIIKS